MASTPRNTLPTGYRIHPKLGTVYGSNPRSADDLTVIRGIDTRQAAGLNRLGIYFLEQIATWTESQAAAVADALGMSASTMSHNGWVAQARALTVAQQSAPSVVRAAPLNQEPPLPASGARTITLLVCALLIGCCGVMWLNRRDQEPMTGVLAAEITNLKVPADSKLLATHVTAGDQVFTGEILLTLEKTEHLRQLAAQSQRVRQLAEDLQKAQAKASLELKWRRQQLQQELSAVRSRAEFFQSVSPQQVIPSLTDGLKATASLDSVHTVSRPRDISQRRQRTINSLLFINGVSGGSTLNTLPLVVARQTSPDTQPGLLDKEARDIEARLQQLEQLQEDLPAQVQLAAGVENLRLLHQEAQDKLSHMESLSRETVVLSPGYGTIGQIEFSDGDQMARDEVMVRILHTDRCYVIVHTPADRIGELRPGHHVTVKFQDHDECQGIVANFPMVDSQLAGTSQISSVRVNATGRAWPTVRPGSTVQVCAE